MAMTKSDLVDRLCENSDDAKKDCAQVIESFFEIIKEEMGKGNNVKISGFGKWSVKDKNARKGRNPQTGKAIMIPSKKVVTFKESHVLREAIQS
ncbi:MAG: integration host factor subunit alpha [Syntrophales bacterium LBB04]|nr:integration host factor subunit alpha [Syntrophales bacterium LBB04]